MKNLKFTFSIIAICVFAFSFAQEKPYLILEDNGENYEVFLKIDDVDNVESVDIFGNYDTFNERTDVAISIDKKKVSKFNNNVALVHTLDKNSSSAEYTILLTCKDGTIKSYPSVEVSLKQIVAKL